jgi:hypothetical protein
MTEPTNHPGAAEEASERRSRAAARLRDAAPQLLAACHEARDWLQQSVDTFGQRLGDLGVLHLLDTAIRSAEGDAP